MKLPPFKNNAPNVALNRVIASFNAESYKPYYHYRLEVDPELPGTIPLKNSEVLTYAETEKLPEEVIYLIKYFIEKFGEDKRMLSPYIWTSHSHMRKVDVIDLKVTESAEGMLEDIRQMFPFAKITNVEFISYIEFCIGSVRNKS